MSRTPDTTTTMAMYANYLQGMTCSKIAEIFGVTRQSVWDRLRRAGHRMRPSSRNLALPFVEFGGARYAPQKDGYFRKTTGDRGLLHWAMWEKTEGPIPRRHVVCFIDGDRMNIKPENLACVRKGEDRRFGRFLSLELKSCLHCGSLMGRRTGWNGHEGPAAYAKRKTCNPQCSAAWKKGKPRGERMPR